MKIVIIDTYYSDFLNGIQRSFNILATYDAELQKTLDYRFGTADFYSRNLRALGHECIDIIGNYAPLQRMWAREHYCSENQPMPSITLKQIEAFKPDIVFMQDLSYFDAVTLKILAEQYLLAGQCSCPMPRPENASQFSFLITSFPHYVQRFKALGVTGSFYAPLAFEPSVLMDRFQKYENTTMYSHKQEFIDGEIPQPERDIEISFVGGVGRNSHWRAGTDVLEAVAEKYGDRFHWYGYGMDNLAGDSPLRNCYRGEAWGRKMYEVYRRSKIVINRHGEVAQGYANNMRLFEATGSGAMLITEEAPNLQDLFPKDTVATYTDAGTLLYRIQYFLQNVSAREFIAQAGQNHTLANHTYAMRMKELAGVLDFALHPVESVSMACMTCRVMVAVRPQDEGKCPTCKTPVITAEESGVILVAEHHAKLAAERSS